MSDVPFPVSDFDDWAESYDGSLDEHQFPFYGYREVLEKTFHLAKARGGMSVLDLGTGTGNLAVLFARAGCEVWGTDFSAAMLTRARLKLPRAHFCLYDLHHEWPDTLPPRFDRIVSAYVFHHFELEEKVRIILKLVNEHLAPDGRLVISDIAFKDATMRAAVRLEVGQEWEDEIYWIADEIIPCLLEDGLKVKYIQVSPCAGVFSLQA
jgi:putative AdoMet-dependent methyltransferase